MKEQIEIAWGSMEQMQDQVEVWIGVLVQEAAQAVLETQL